MIVPHFKWNSELVKSLTERGLEQRICHYALFGCVSPQTLVALVSRGSWPFPFEAPVSEMTACRASF